MSSYNIIVAPDTPLIGFLSPGPATKALIDNILESNPCSLPVLDLLDSRIDTNLSSKLVSIITEELVTQTPPQSKTSEQFPEAEQAERKRKRSDETKTVLYQTASVLNLHAELLCQDITVPAIADYIVKWIHVVLNYTFSITGTQCYGIKLFLSIVKVNHTASYKFNKN